MILQIGVIRCIQIQKLFDVRIPTYHLSNLSERYSEASLKKSELTMEEKKGFYEKIKNRLRQIVFDHHC